KGSVTKKLVDETHNQLRSVQASLEEAEAGVASAEAARDEADAFIFKAEADLVAAAARLRVAQANQREAETLLNYCEIKAPFDGVITARSVDTGHYVHPANGGQNVPLLVVARTDRVRVFVDIPETEAPL